MCQIARPENSSSARAIPASISGHESPSSARKRSGRSVATGTWLIPPGLRSPPAPYPGVAARASGLTTQTMDSIARSTLPPGRPISAITKPTAITPAIT